MTEAMRSVLRIARKFANVNHYAEYGHQLWWRFVLPRLLRRAGVRLGPDITFYGAPIVTMTQQGRIVIGARCSLCSHSRYTALGTHHPIILRLLRPGASIRIGSDTGISGGAICAAQSIEIGSNVLLGANVTIVDTDFHAIKPAGRRYNANATDIGVAPVHINDNVFIGTGAMILKGVIIGENSVIGAGSVVTRSIPDNVIAAGNPARVLKKIDC